MFVLFIPLTIHSQLWSGSGLGYRSLPKLVQALRVDLDILRSQHMPGVLA